MSDTIARLAALHLQQNQHLAGNASADRLRDVSGFGSNPGALRARYYLPEELSEGAPLVVVLHGCTQNAAGYDHGAGWSQLADRAGFALLFPEQQRSNNPNLCFNWFVPADTKRDSGEALSIRQMVETLVDAHGLDRKRIFVTGLSAGGAMASVMLAAYPEVFAGGAIIAGLAYGSANTIPEAFDRMRGHGGPSEEELQRLLRGASKHEGAWPRISIWQGTADHTVLPSNAEAVLGQWRGVHRSGKTPTRSEVVDGHVRRVWCDGDGREVLEAYTIAGMGHGTPLNIKGDDGLGAPAPFMLDVGISSTMRIASFWGIAPSNNHTTLRSRQQNPDAGPLERNSRAIATMETTPRQPRHEQAASPTSSSAGVRKIIEDALRTAGLMR